MTGRPVVAGIAGALLIAFSAIFVRLAEVSPSTAAFFRCLYALPFLWPLVVYERRRHGRAPARERRVAMLAGVFFAIDLTLWHVSIGAVGAGLSTVIANVQVVLVGLIAWAVLGERPSRSSMAAVPLVLGGVVLISGVIGANAYGDDPLLGVVTGVGTAIAYAIFMLVLRRGLGDLRRAAGPLFDATLSAAVVSALIGVALGELDPVPAWPAHAWLLSLAVTSQVIAWLLISLSLPRLPALLTSIVLTLQPVGSVILGVVLLSEAPSQWQLAGVVVILSGVLVATLGRSPRAPEPVGPRAEPAAAPVPAGARGR